MPTKLSALGCVATLLAFGTLAASPSDGFVFTVNTTLTTGPIYALNPDDFVCSAINMGSKKVDITTQYVQYDGTTYTPQVCRDVAPGAQCADHFNGATGQYYCRISVPGVGKRVRESVRGNLQDLQTGALSEAR